MLWGAATARGPHSEIFCYGPWDSGRSAIFLCKRRISSAEGWIFRVDEQLSIDVCFTPESRQIADVSGAICYCAIGASDLLSYIYCPGIGTRPDFPSYGSQQLVHHCEIGGMVRSVRVTNPQPQR